VSESRNANTTNEGLISKLNALSRYVNRASRLTNQDKAYGYSILELVVVIAILSAIAGIAFPSINRWIALARIDSVKTLLNSAAAECLQGIREGNSPEEIPIKETTVSNETLGSYGYKIKESDKSCASFFVIPINEDEKFMYPLGVKINSLGEIAKIAIPASDSGSLNSCKNWAGVNCGVSPEQQAIWDALAKIEKDKKTCNDEFYTWLQKPSSGSNNRWDETTKSCTLETWAYKGSIQKDQAAVQSARAADLGAECAAKLKAKSSESPPFDGLFSDPDCGSTYFCSGKDLATDSLTAYSACKEEERVQKCTAALGDWKNTKANGKFEVAGCQAAWACNGTYYNTQTDFDKTTCACTWQDESYQNGTAQESYQCGTTTSQVCGRTVFGRCVQWNDVSTPQYCTRTVATYGTRKVCK